MSHAILVAYASRYGSTREIAEYLQDELWRETNRRVDLMDLSEVKDLSPYHAVVAGSAIYEAAWLDPMVHFLTENEAVLKDKELWLFSSGPVEEGSPAALLGGWKFPEHLEPLIERLAPRDVTVFSGKFDPERLNLDDWCIQRNLRTQAADFRDWKAIRAWADQVARCLAPTRV